MIFSMIKSFFVLIFKLIKFVYDVARNIRDFMKEIMMAYTKQQRDYKQYKERNDLRRSFEDEIF